VSGRKITPATDPKISIPEPAAGKRSPQFTRWIEAKSVSGALALVGGAVAAIQMLIAAAAVILHH
jgi:hypothetical protein